MRTDDQGAGARRPTRTGVAVVGVMGVAALALLAASGFALTLLARPIDRDKATAASFVLGAVGGAFMSFALTTGGALVAQSRPPRDALISRVTTGALGLTALVLLGITVTGFVGGVWPQRVLGVLPLAAAALCVVEARRVARGYAVLIAEGEVARDRALRSAPPD